MRFQRYRICLEIIGALNLLPLAIRPPAFSPSCTRQLQRRGWHLGPIGRGLRLAVPESVGAAAARKAEVHRWGRRDRFARTDTSGAESDFAQSPLKAVEVQAQMRRAATPASWQIQPERSQSLIRLASGSVGLDGESAPRVGRAIDADCSAASAPAVTTPLRCRFSSGMF